MALSSPSRQEAELEGWKPCWSGHIPGRVDISQRPAVVERKKRIGDWEADTIIGKGHSGAMVSLVDRATRYTLLKRVDRKTSEAVCVALIELLGSVANITVFLLAIIDQLTDDAITNSIKELRFNPMNYHRRLSRLTETFKWEGGYMLEFLQIAAGLITIIIIDDDDDDSYDW